MWFDNLEGSKNPLFLDLSVWFLSSSCDFGDWLMKQPGLFDVDARLALLSSLGNQIETFSLTVNFEVFRPDLEKILT